jgi:fumarylacetoacetase
MTYEINETHSPDLKSWVESANNPNTDFPIQNLPFCVFKRDEDLDGGTLGTVIGDFVIDLKYFIQEVLEIKYFDLSGSAVENLANISGFTKTDLRSGLVKYLSESADEYARSDVQQAMTPISEVSFEVPYKIGDYTDFYASIYHATNVGSMFRPDNPLLPNYKYVPIGYHGRASSIYIPCKNLDYEMEVGFFVGDMSYYGMGETIPIAEAEKHIFGLCLVNDWSARDIQAWEYQPLGPFLAKNFATSISPFIVTMEALAPFRSAAFARPEGDPQPLPYLYDEQNQKFGGLDIQLEVFIASQKMRDEKIEPMLLSSSNMKDLYWTIGQMLAHHASNGCNLQTGDLIASGTVSGKEKHERGCMLELTWRGKEPLTLTTGEERRFLEDGDEVIMRGFCEREGFRRIGFGECRGIILPA